MKGEGEKITQCYSSLCVLLGLREFKLKNITASELIELNGWLAGCCVLIE